MSIKQTKAGQKKNLSLKLLFSFLMKLFFNTGKKMLKCSYFMTRLLINIIQGWQARAKSLTGCVRPLDHSMHMPGRQRQETFLFCCCFFRSGVSPEGCQECAVVSEDVGNFLVCVVVIRVLLLKVADDVPLAPLIGNKTHIHM